MTEKVYSKKITVSLSQLDANNFVEVIYEPKHKEDMGLKEPIRFRMRYSKKAIVPVHCLLIPNDLFIDHQSSNKDSGFRQLIITTYIKERTEKRNIVLPNNEYITFVSSAERTQTEAPDEVSDSFDPETERRLRNGEEIEDNTVNDRKFFNAETKVKSNSKAKVIQVDQYNQVEVGVHDEIVANKPNSHLIVRDPQTNLLTAFISSKGNQYLSGDHKIVLDDESTLTFDVNKAKDSKSSSYTDISGNVHYQLLTSGNSGNLFKKFQDNTSNARGLHIKEGREYLCKRYGLDKNHQYVALNAKYENTKTPVVSEPYSNVANKSSGEDAKKSLVSNTFKSRIDAKKLEALDNLSLDSYEGSIDLEQSFGAKERFSKQRSLKEKFGSNDSNVIPEEEENGFTVEEEVILKESDIDLNEENPMDQEFVGLPNEDGEDVNSQEELAVGYLDENGVYHTAAEGVNPEEERVNPEEGDIQPNEEDVKPNENGGDQNQLQQDGEQPAAANGKVDGTAPNDKKGTVTVPQGEDVNEGAVCGCIC